MAEKSLQPIRYRVAEASYGVASADALELEITAVLGTGERVAPGERFAVRGQYRALATLAGLPLILSSQGTSRGVLITLEPGTHPFAVTAEIVTVNSGQERTLDLFVKDDQAARPPALLRLRLGETAAKLDYAKLALKGDARTQDHFSLTVQAAAKLLGREADYATIFALSTNAFAPAIQPGEDCMSWWTLYGRGVGLELVAASLGLTAQRLAFPAPAPTPADAPAAFDQKTAEQMKTSPPVVRAAMDAGAVVLTEGGWQVKGPHGFVPWGWWGLITAARDGGPIVGATLNGFTDNPLEFLHVCYALAPGGAPLVPADADRQALRLAVERIRGTGRFAPGHSLFGLAAMDRWIQQMSTVPGFCPGCHQRGQKGWTDATDNALAVAAAAKVATQYLRTRQATLPAGAQPHLARAAACYDHIQALLQPALTGQGGETYRQFIGDLAKQQAHVETVLKPVKAELAAAADAMEQALAQAGAARIDMPPPANAPGNIYARGLSAILAYLGTDVSYDRILGLTGVAFILQVDTSGPYVGQDLDCAWWPNDDWGFALGLPVLAQATGWPVRRLGCDYATYKADPAAEYRRTFAPAVAASLRAGKPVLAYGFIGTATDDQEPPLLGYGTRGKSTQFSQQPERIDRHPWLLYVVGEKTLARPAAEVDRASLRHLLALWNEQAQGPDAPKTRFGGRQAWAEWLKLQHAGNGHDNNMLIHLRYNRRAAVAYLREMAGRHQGAAATRLTAAAALYQLALDNLNAATLPYGNPEPSTPADYTARCERVFALETAAMAELAHALAALAAPGAEAKPASAAAAAPLKREGGKVWLENVPRQQGQTSVLAALTSCLKYAGEDVTYEYLMGVSSHAFRLQYDGCPSAPHAFCGFNTAEPALRAFGYALTQYPANRPGHRADLAAPTAEQVAAALTALRTSVAAGVPALGDWEESGVLAGYEPPGTGKSGLLDAKGQTIKELPWSIGIVTKAGPAPARRASVLWSLRTAVAHAHAATLSGYSADEQRVMTYPAGFAAWTRWLAELAPGGAMDTLPDDQWVGAVLGNAWTYECLLDARRAAAAYLRAVAAELGPETAAHLGAAAQQYEAVTKALAGARSSVRYPWQLKGRVEWTPAMRAQQAQALQAALAAERAAVAELEQALAAGGDPPAAP